MCFGVGNDPVTARRDFAEAVALCRGRVSADEQDGQAQLALAQALMNSAQADRLGRPIFCGRNAEKLKEVISEATKAIDVLSHTEIEVSTSCRLDTAGVRPIHYRA